jgi:hypothetical protein
MVGARMESGSKVWVISLVGRSEFDPGYSIGGSLNESEAVFLVGVKEREGENRRDILGLPKPESVRFWTPS